MKKIIIALFGIIFLFSLHLWFAISQFYTGSNYRAWDVVQNNGRYYECKESPYTELCKEGTFYEPWVGIYWQEAWNDVTGEIQWNDNSISYTTISGYPWTPLITNLPRTYWQGNYSISWIIPRNTPTGTKVKLEENGDIIQMKNITSTDEQRTGTFYINGRNNWVYSYYVYMCDTISSTERCSRSAGIEIKVNDYSTSTTSFSSTDFSENTLLINDDIKRVMESIKVYTGSTQIDLSRSSNNLANVKRVINIISGEKWKQIFPIAKPQYTYEKFLQAVALFPKFCGEQGSYIGEDKDTTCKRELATLFAHMTYTTGLQAKYASVPWYNSLYLDTWKQGLYYTKQTWIAEDKYMARWPMMISGRENYKILSLSLYNNESTLLNSPEIVSENWFIGLASAIWYYMIPQNERPSLHDIVVGYWKPNATEMRNGLEQWFWATINAINHDLCGQEEETTEAQTRINFFSEFANALQVNMGSSYSCKKAGYFEKSNYPVVRYYWEKDSKYSSCKLVSYVTDYSFFWWNTFEKCSGSSSTNSSSNTSTNTSTTTSTSTNTSTTTNTTTNSSGIKRSEIPKFDSLAGKRNVINYEQVLESRVIKTIRKNKMKSVHIKALEKKIDAWGVFLQNLNRQGKLTGSEKRSMFILKMLNEKFEKYD
jgi:hypothetical protein